MQLAHAEPCAEVVGCIGKIWYVHIPKSQLQAKKIFTKAGLPNVNATETLSRNASLLDAYSFSISPYPEDLRKELKRISEKDKVLDHWGSILNAGSKVRILSYQTFPALGDMGNELFALVLVT